MTTHQIQIRGRRLLPALLLTIGAALAGCGGDEEPVASAAPASPAAASSTAPAPSTSGSSTSGSSSSSGQPTAPTPVNPPASVPGTSLDRAPSLTGTAQAATTIGSNYVFSPVATDAD